MTEKKPDVISLELVMPKMSGLKFFKYIQKNKERAGIPVVVVTVPAFLLAGTPQSLRRMISV
jgi:CheY-like chemotaxis protein